MVHVYFDAFRGVFLGISTFLVVAFAWQLYLDRIALEKLFFRSPRRYKTHRVFRVSIFFGAVFSLLVGIDFYGAHNIYSPWTRVALLTVASLPVPSVMGIAIVNELQAAFALVEIGPNTAKAITYASASTSPLCGLVVLLALYIDNRGYYIFSKVIYTLALFVGAGVTNYVYYILRRHFKTMVKLNMSFAKKFWTDLLGRWRMYTIAFSIVCLVLLGSHTLQGLDPANANISIDNVNFEIDYTVVPTSYQIVSALSNIGTLMLLGWRSWIGKVARKKLSQESKKSSDTDTKKPLSGSNRGRNISGVSDIHVAMHSGSNAGSRSHVEMSNIDSTASDGGDASLPGSPRFSSARSSSAIVGKKRLVSFSAPTDIAFEKEQLSRHSEEGEEELSKGSISSETSVNKGSLEHGGSGLLLDEEAQAATVATSSAESSGHRRSIHVDTASAAMV